MRHFFASPRAREITIDTTLTPEGEAWLKSLSLERTIRITLAGDGVWPAEVKRGQAVRLTFDVGSGPTTIVTGRVRFRRLRTAVIDGTVELAQ